MKFQLFLEAARKLISPKLKLRYRDESWWRFLPKSFQKSWTTQSKNVIYLPSREHVKKMNVTSAVAVLLHEIRHIIDMKRGPCFHGVYLSPQILSIVSALSAVGVHLYFCFPWPIWLSASIAFVALLAPWRSRERAWLEDHAYAVSTWVRIRQYRNFDDLDIRAKSVASLSLALRSWTYYKMIWRRKTADKLANNIVDMAILWCRCERLGGMPSPDPFDNREFRKIVMDLLEEPFEKVWKS